MGKLLAAVAMILTIAVADPAAASGPPLAAAVEPTASGFAVLSGEAAGGPGGPAHDFVASCQAIATPPQPAHVLVHVWCTVNGAIVANQLMPGGVGAVAVSNAPVTVSSTTGFNFCVHVQFIGVPTFVAPVCRPFVSL